MHINDVRTRKKQPAGACDCARSRTQWRSQGGGQGGHGPPKLLVVNVPINLRCYVLLGCRVINVILAIHIGDSAFVDIAALVRQFRGIRHHQQTESIHWPLQTKILATPLRARKHTPMSMIRA